MGLFDKLKKKETTETTQVARPRPLKVDIIIGTEWIVKSLN